MTAAARRSLHVPGLTTMDPGTSYTETSEVYSDFPQYATDYSINHTCDEEQMGMQAFYTVVQPVLYSIIFLLGLAGNGLMIVVLLRRRNRLRITEIYLLHLALADLMLIFTLPFKLIDNICGWVFGGFLCMLTGLLENLTLFCGCFLLACIGFDRYLAIVHAIPSMQRRRPRIVHLTCMSLWFFSLLLSLPNVVFLSVESYSNGTAFDCYFYRFEVHSHNWVVANRILHNVCFFFCLGVMCYCYSALVITLCNSQRGQAKKAAIRLALLVTLVFCLCWLPFSVTSLIKTLAEFDVITYSVCDSVILLNEVYVVSYSLGVSHCCLNPFLYAFVGVQFRSELLHLLCRLGCARICSRFVPLKDPVHGRSSFSDGTSISKV